MREILMVHEKAVQDFWHRQYDPFRCQVAEEWQLLNATPVLACLPKHGGRLQLIVAFQPHVFNHDTRNCSLHLEV